MLSFLWSVAPCVFFRFGLNFLAHPQKAVSLSVSLCLNGRLLIIHAPLFDVLCIRRYWQRHHLLGSYSYGISLIIKFSFLNSTDFHNHFLLALILYCIVYNTIQIKFIMLKRSHQNVNLRCHLLKIQLIFQFLESQEEIVSFESHFEGR